MCLLQVNALMCSRNMGVWCTGCRSGWISTRSLFPPNSTHSTRAPRPRRPTWSRPLPSRASLPIAPQRSASGTCAPVYWSHWWLVLISMSVYWYYRLRMRHLSLSLSNSQFLIWVRLDCVQSSELASLRAEARAEARFSEPVYVVSAQSAEQRELLEAQPTGPTAPPLFVDGGYQLYVRGRLTTYFVLRAEPALAKLDNFALKTRRPTGYHQSISSSHLISALLLSLVYTQSTSPLRVHVHYIHAYTVTVRMRVPERTRTDMSLQAGLREWMCTGALVHLSTEILDKFWAPSMFDPSPLIDRNWQSRFKEELAGADIEEFVPSEHEQEDGTILAICSV